MCVFVQIPSLDMLFPQKSILTCCYVTVTQSFQTQSTVTNAFVKNCCEGDLFEFTFTGLNITYSEAQSAIGWMRNGDAIRVVGNLRDSSLNSYLLYAYPL